MVRVMVGAMVCEFGDVMSLLQRVMIYCDSGMACVQWKLCKCHAVGLRRNESVNWALPVYPFNLPCLLQFVV